MNAIMPRATIEDIVRNRNEALALYEIAHSKIIDAHNAEMAAIEVARSAFPGTNSLNFGQEQRTKQLQKEVTNIPREDYMREARHIIDLNIWAWIVERTDLERLMDKTAKDQLRKQMSHIVEPAGEGHLLTQEELEKGLPPITVENIYATLEQFMLNADMIFKRGIATAFSKLDRRFRSHDGFKVGSRVILPYCFTEFGSWNYHRNERDTLMDIERTFAVIDGKMVGHSYATTVGAIDENRRIGSGKRQSEIDTDYFLIRIYMNGNAHLWMKRHDLVRKVNKLLGEYYGETIGDGQQAEEDPFANIKHTPAKRYGFFPTPDGLSDRVIEEAAIRPPEATEPRLRILEPSSGTGNLARRCIINGADWTKDWSRYDEDRIEKFIAEHRWDNQVDCVEIQQHLAVDLRAEGIYGRVFAQDFLQLQPSTTGLYDRVVMNPPFDRERDIDHVVHALKFLKPDGVLIAIMSAGTEFRETKKSVAFRDLVKSRGGYFNDLPERSFAESGTNINTIMLVIGKSRW
ncbi:MAG: DUF4942 domain-containing protein [Mesorhizobium sp.]|nr:MAG: DUF4942 domain-containing protein [Mesorhizobium sp.]